MPRIVTFTSRCSIKAYQINEPVTPFFSPSCSVFFLKHNSFLAVHLHSIHKNPKLQQGRHTWPFTMCTNLSLQVHQLPLQRANSILSFLTPPPYAHLLFSYSELYSTILQLANMSRVPGFGLCCSSEASAPSHLSKDLLARTTSLKHYLLSPLLPPSPAKISTLFLAIALIRLYCDSQLTYLSF